MFIRAWGKPENVGNDDLAVEQYVAIRYIMRFYSKRYEGEAENRYVIATGADRLYITEEAFQYLKTLRNRNHHEQKTGPASRLTRS